MQESTTALGASVDRLADRVAALEHRLERLESAAHAVEPPPGETAAAVQGATSTLGLEATRALVPLVGRTLLVLAGAFLLRALAESGWLAPRPAVIAGLAFAVVWIVLADRAGRTGPASAVFHGFSFVLIAFPLLFEAATRFQFLTPVTSAVGLGAGSLSALFVAWRRRLRPLAWVAAIAGLVTALALALAHAQLGPFAVYLVLLGTATLWLGYDLEWRLLRWPVACVADLAILLLSVRASVPGSADTPAMAFAAQILILVAYLGSFATRTLLLNRDVIPFEVAQSIAATAVGLGGAAYLARHGSGGGLVFGLATLVLAAGCYGAAAVFVERRQSRRRNYYVYTTAGLALAVAGAALALPAGAVGLVYGAFGVVAAWVGRLASHVTYRAHGVAYLAAGAAATGLLRLALYGLGLPVSLDAGASAPAIVLLGLSGAALWGLGFGAAAGPVAAARRVPRLLTVALLIGGTLGVAATVAAPHPEGPVALTGSIATLRTALLAGAVIAAATASRVWTFPEGGWLVYPLLTLTGIKFLMEDVRVGRPVTLVVSFALYGAALIAAPRIAQRRSRVTD